MINKDTLHANAIKWSDIDFTADPMGGIKSLINADAVKQSIRNILNTRQGERFFRPDFGSGVFEQVFELMDADLSDFLSVQVKKAIESYDSRVEVLSVKFEMRHDQRLVDLLLYFTIKGFDQAFEYRQTVGG